MADLSPQTDRHALFLPVAQPVSVTFTDIDLCTHPLEEIN